MLYLTQSLKLRLLMLLSFFLAYGTIYSLQHIYVGGVMRENTPFYMSQNYVKLETEVDDTQLPAVDAVLDIKEQDLTILTFYEAAGEAAIYDPRNLFLPSLANTGQNYHNDPRFKFKNRQYFSMDDYIKRRKVHLKVLGRKEADAAKDYEYYNFNEYYKYCLVSEGNKLYEVPGIKNYHNLTALQTLGKTVYLDADRQENVDLMVKRLQVYGYEVQEYVNKNFLAVILKVLLDVDNGNAVFYMTKRQLLMAIGLYVLALISILKYWHLERDFILISHTHGAGVWEVFKERSKYFVPAVSLGAVAAFGCELLRYRLQSAALINKEWFTEYLHVCNAAVLLFHTLTVLLFFAGAYYFTRRNILRERGYE